MPKKENKTPKSSSLDVLVEEVIASTEYPSTRWFEKTPFYCGIIENLDALWKLYEKMFELMAMAYLKACEIVLRGGIVIYPMQVIGGCIYTMRHIIPPFILRPIYNITDALSYVYEGSRQLELAEAPPSIKRICRNSVLALREMSREMHPILFEKRFFLVDTPTASKIKEEASRMRNWYLEENYPQYEECARHFLEVFAYVPFLDFALRALAEFSNFLNMDIPPLHAYFVFQDVLIATFFAVLLKDRIEIFERNLPKSHSIFYRGEEPVVNFKVIYLRAYTCPACKEIESHLKFLARAVAKRQVILIDTDTREGKFLLDAWLARHTPTFITPYAYVPAPLVEEEKRGFGQRRKYDFRTLKNLLTLSHAIFGNIDYEAILPFIHPEIAQQLHYLWKKVHGFTSHEALET